MLITPETTLNMVIGFPLEHSQSPTFHQKLYQQLELNAVMLAFSQAPLHSLIEAIKTLSVELTAVTMPYKEKILPYLDEYSDEVRILQSANTIIQRHGKLCGYNTDIAGIAFALQKISSFRQKVLVIGAGGTARAAGYFLQQKEAEIFWVNRSFEKAQLLARTFGGIVLSLDDIQSQAALFDIVIHTTPIGMAPAVNASIFSDAFAEKFFQSHHIVFDFIYNPEKTLFLKQAEKNGARIINGQKMFIGQAIRQIELWTGRGDLHELYNH